MPENIAALIVALEEEGTLQAVRTSLETGADPLSLVESLRTGMATVGERFEAKEYFLPDLIMAGEIFKEAIALVEPHLTGDGGGAKGTVVLGTVRGDIHDIGKNLVGTMLRCHGYDVHDLGVDVAPQAFADKVKETGAGLVAMSGLLTLAFDAMRETVEVLAEAGLQESTRVIIGGGPVNQTVVKFSGADACGKDPAEAVRLASTYLGA